MVAPGHNGGGTNVPIGESSNDLLVTVAPDIIIVAARGELDADHVFDGLMG